MRRITWSISKWVSETHIYGITDPHFAYSLFNFYGATMTIKGSLLLSVPIVKPKILARQNRFPKFLGTDFGENGFFHENGI